MTQLDPIRFHCCEQTCAPPLCLPFAGTAPQSWSPRSWCHPRPKCQWCPAAVGPWCGTIELYDRLGEQVKDQDRLRGSWRYTDHTLIVNNCELWIIWRCSGSIWRCCISSLPFGTNQAPSSCPWQWASHFHPAQPSGKHPSISWPWRSYRFCWPLRQNVFPLEPKYAETACITKTSFVICTSKLKCDWDCYFGPRPTIYHSWTS